VFQYPDDISPTSGSHQSARDISRLRTRTLMRSAGRFFFRNASSPGRMNHP